MLPPIIDTYFLSTVWPSFSKASTKSNLVTEPNNLSPADAPSVALAAILISNCFKASNVLLASSITFLSLKARCFKVSSNAFLADFVAKNPDKYGKLLKEWDYDKNGKNKPSQFTEFSSRKFWWKCPSNHSYKAVVSNRTKGSGCPKCYRLKKRFLT